VRSGADLRRQLYREERQRVAGEQYLDKVEQKLRGELAAMGVDTEARAEEEQQQGWDAEYVDELDSQLREELAAMGVDTARKDDPESEVGESIDREYVEGLETKLRHELYRMGVKPDAAPASRRRERLVDEAPAKQVDLGALGAQLAQLDTRPDNVVDDELVEMEYGAPAERPAPTAPEPAEARPTDEPDLAAPIAIDEQQDGEEKQPAAAPAAPQGEAAPAEAATAAAAPSSSPQIEGAQPEAAPEAPQPEAAPEAPQPEAVSRGPRRRRIPHHTPAAPVPAVKDAPDGEWVIELPDDE